MMHQDSRHRRHNLVTTEVAEEAIELAAALRQDCRHKRHNLVSNKLQLGIVMGRLRFVLRGTLRHVRRVLSYCPVVVRLRRLANRCGGCGESARKFSHPHQ